MKILTMSLIKSKIQSKEVVKLGGHEEEVKCGRFSSDSLKVVTACKDSIARIFQVDTVAGVFTESEINPLHVLPKTKGALFWAEFQPNNSDMLVTAGRDEIARIYSLNEDNR